MTRRPPGNLSPLLLLAALSLGACDRIDAEQLRDCERVIPALEALGTRIEVLHGEPDPTAENAVVVHYRILGGPAEPARHWVSCRFGGADLEAERRNITAIATDREGQLSAVQLQILRRFWLGTLEAQADVQAAPPARENVPRALLYLLQTGINAVVPCGIYGLLAVAYTLVYAILGRINLAFGELSMIAAFTAWLAIVLFAAAVVGGIGSVPGAKLGGVLIAFVETC